LNIILIATMRVSIIAFLTLFVTSSVDAFAPSPKVIHYSSLYANIDVNENAQRNVGPMDEWATNCGVQKAEGFQLTSEDGMDYSVMTNTDLPAGSPVLAVPAGMIISTSSAKAELEAMSGGGVQAAVKELNMIGGGVSIPKFYLFLKILVEYERGQESPYFPWLDSLPRLYYNSVSMTDFCYECLPPFVFSLCRVERVKFDNFLQVLKKVDIISEDTKTRKELCKWAFNAMNTRCLGEPGGEQKIVPMGDMFNHGTDTEVEIAFDEQGNCNAFTTSDVPAGYPLRMSYGCPTNPSHFFATYGFLDETSPATFCKVMDIKSTPELVNLGFDFSKMLFYKDTGDISEEVWDTMLYAKVLAQNPNVQQQFYEAHMTGNVDMKSAIHQQYMLETSSLLKKHVDDFIDALEKLSAKGVGKDMNEHPRLPLILRHNEFVNKSFWQVKARLDPMVQQFSLERALV